jgi:starvation-inducible DNA-binding protein
MAEHAKRSSGSRDQLVAENTPSSPLVDALRIQVANGVVLYANYKQYHWRTYGPLFRDLHLMFDEFAEAVRHGIDELAERIRMIGQDPPRDLMEMVDMATVRSAASEGSIRDMVAEADRNAQIVIKEMRAGAKLADERDDPGSVDLFSKLVQVHEKQEWWLRDILRGHDGLSEPLRAEGKGQRAEVR